MTLILGKKLTELTARVAPASTDLLYIYNSITGQSNKVSLDALGIYFGLQPSGGVIDNLYTADGVLTGERQVDGDGNNMYFVNFDEFEIQANNTISLLSSTSLYGAVTNTNTNVISFYHNNIGITESIFGEFIDTTDSGDGFDIKGFQHRNISSSIDYLFGVQNDDENIIIKTSNYIDNEESIIYVSATNISLGVNGVYSSNINLFDDGRILMGGRAARLPNDADPDVNTLFPSNGMISYDTTDHEFRAYINGAWTGLGGGALDATLLSGNQTNGTDISVTEGDSINISANPITYRTSKLTFDSKAEIFYDESDKDEFYIEAFGALGMKLGAGNGVLSLFDTGMSLGTNVRTFSILDTDDYFRLTENSGVTKLGFVNNGFTGKLTAPVYTVNRDWLLPDNDGTIALTLDTLYGGNGTLTSNRTVAGNTFDMRFQNTGVFSVTSIASVAMTCDFNMLLTSTGSSIGLNAETAISLTSITDNIDITSTGYIELNGRIDLNSIIVTNALAVTYTLDFSNTNIIYFTADSDTVLSFTGIPTNGSVNIIIETAGFNVSLATTDNWFTKDGIAPTILGKTILTAISDGTTLTVNEVSNILELV